MKVPAPAPLLPHPAPSASQAAPAPAQPGTEVVMPVRTVWFGTRSRLRFLIQQGFWDTLGCFWHQGGHRVPPVLPQLLPSLQRAVPARGCGAVGKK